MTAQYDAAESARLVAEAREDDARMTPVPWDCVPLIVRHFVDVRPTGADAFGVARTRNNLSSIADQLEAAVAEAEHSEGWRMQCAANERGMQRLTAERDSLRRQLREANDRAALGAVEVDKREAECRASRQRIAELEAARDRGYALAVRADQLEAILRAIYPVYRAVDSWAKESELVKAGVPGADVDRCFALEEQADSAVSTARTALTPDIVAALERLGLETP